jgi:D-beta-D-heptose 7-phosphate kinase/D-beta-D-heptose 1-phosphate adenosyltransferase
MLSNQRADAIIQGFESTRIMVIGDIMIDQFVIGQVNRISPEAPVPVVKFQHEEFRLGGAANVAHNIRKLGGSVSLLGVLGSDDAGTQLLAELKRASIDPSDVFSERERTTTRKLRVVTSRNQQVARIDYETDKALSRDIVDKLSALLKSQIATADVIVVSDYLKGLLNQELMAELLLSAKDHGVPVFVDPKAPHLNWYSGCSLMTPNHHEAEKATGMRIQTEDEARAAASTLQTSVPCTSVLITRGEHGMWLTDGSLPGADRVESALPTTAREVSDVTGAGDTVIAMMALSVAAGANLSEAAELANHAAGIVVGRFGASTVTTKELLGAFA